MRECKYQFKESEQVMTITPQEVEQLYAPFPLEVHSIREGHKTSTGKIQWFVYLDRMAIQRRLDELFPGEWEAIYLGNSTDDEVTTVYMSIVIRGLRRDFNGTGKPRRSKSSDEEGIDENSPKSAATDAFRRAASLWGLGAYMWEMPAIYTAGYTPGKWDEKDAREKEAKQKLATWYQNEFGSQQSGAAPRQTPQKPQGATQPAAPAQSGTKARKSPYGDAQPKAPGNSANQAGWELNDASEGVLILQVKNALPNENGKHVFDEVKKMRAANKFANCATFADAVALAIADFDKPNMDVAF